MEKEIYRLGDKKKKMYDVISYHIGSFRVEDAVCEKRGKKLGSVKLKC